MKEDTYQVSIKDNEKGIETNFANHSVRTKFREQYKVSGL